MIYHAGQLTRKYIKGQVDAMADMFYRGVFINEYNTIDMGSSLYKKVRHLPFSSSKFNFK